MQRRRANPVAATEQRERARRTDGSQRPTESLAGEPKGRRQPASQWLVEEVNPPRNLQPALTCDVPPTGRDDYDIRR